MIVKILSRGKSFKGLATYLTHDPQAKTEERVAWTHTLNLSNDHVPSAVDEMLWTARNAELLKQEAGLRAGGRSTENTVKHVSLNWAPGEEPTREHMVETTEAFLRHMKWDEHQAVLVAHSDKAYAHVHVALNVVHPETGLKLDDNFEKRRAQAWALDYEREQGLIHCTQRLENVTEREDAPTRPAWMAFKGKELEFEAAEKARSAQEPILIRDAENTENPNDLEWKRLKEIQRTEREGFFVDGKMAFSELRTSIYREVREEFRERWADHFTARDNGENPERLVTEKSELVAEQKAVLETRRDEACGELRVARDLDYRELLDSQREARLDLRARQELGLESGLFLDLTEHRDRQPTVADSFRTAAAETTARADAPMLQMEEEAPASFSSHERTGLKSGPEIGVSLGMGVMSLFEGLADGLVWSKPDPKPLRTEGTSRKDERTEEIIAEGRDRQRREQEEADRLWRQNQRERLWGPIAGSGRPRLFPLLTWQSITKLAPLTALIRATRKMAAPMPASKTSSVASWRPCAGFGLPIAPTRCERPGTSARRPSGA